ncbi:DUF1302 domain-containing protein [Pseudomonas sp. MOB-449]|nr:DUF1302 domain-containing protein [Pseudomonas sp. MOB-449]
MTIRNARLTSTRLALPSLLLFSELSQSVTLQPSEDLSINSSTVVSYGLAMRTEKRAHALSSHNPAAANRDDGNNAFDRGSLISHRVGVLSDADFNWQRDFGLFVRASAYYDDVYHRRNDNRSGTSNCFAGGQCSRPDRFSSQTADAHGGEVRMLDSYLYGSWQVAERPFNLRLGRQVVNWGEALYNGAGISSAMSPADATKSNVPGVEVKEQLLPVGQVLTQYALTDSLDLQAYVQYEWKPNELNAVGSYFSTTDFIDKGGFNDATGNLHRLPDDEPRDSGQYGIALRYVAEQWNSTEFGFYRLRFHSKTPQLDFQSQRAKRAYQARYFDDIDLYGSSFATNIGDTSVSGELSYLDGQPIAVGRTAVRGKMAQTLLSAIHPIGATPLADNLTLTGEVGYNRVLDTELANPAERNGDTLANDRSAWGYTLNANLRYIDLFSGWDLSVPITVSQGVRGVSSLSGTYREGNTRLSFGTTWQYLGNLAIDARYNLYLGSPDDNPQTDRDHLALSARYSF